MMKQPLILNATNSTPQIRLDSNNGLLQFKGRSTPEHPAEYYATVNDWIEKYLHQPNKSTTIELYFEYFNTSSSKCLLELLRKLAVLAQAGKDIRFVWFHEVGDDDMRETGKDFQEILKVSFDIIAI
jgi:hypothetical protein